MITRSHKGIAAAALLSLAILNYFNTSNRIVTLTDAPLADLNEMPDPFDPGLSRKLTHNRRGVQLELYEKRQRKIFERRQQWAIANQEKKNRRVALRNLNNGKETSSGSTVQLPEDMRSLENLSTIPLSQKEEDLIPHAICSRPTDVGSARDFALLRRYSKKQCPGVYTHSVLLLDGSETYGRTGNNLIEFLHALQYARDKDIQLGIMSGSWAMQVLLKMWMAILEDNEDHWIERFEDAFCVKIFKRKKELEKWNVIRKTSKELFYFVSESPLREYINSQEDSLRTMWHSYNTGEGVDSKGRDVDDMCSGIDAVFGDNKQDAIYSVIHSRHLEQIGPIALGNMSKRSGCDPTAALEMRPDYVKSILAPLGMLNYPIVLITDGQDFQVIQRLLTDPDIGPKLRLVPQEASWVGGDLTLAIMSNVFIGNPASTFSGFIAKSRLSIGFGHNYLFRAKNGKGNWATVCGDECIFDRKIMGPMS